MEQIIHDEKNGLDYQLVGDYYLPMLKSRETPQIGRFGRMLCTTITSDSTKKHYSAVYGYPVR